MSLEKRVDNLISNTGAKLGSIDHCVYFVSFSIAGCDGEWKDEEDEKITQMIANITSVKHGEKAGEETFKEEAKIADEALAYFNDCVEEGGYGLCMRESTKAMAEIAEAETLWKFSDKRMGLTAIRQSMFEIAMADGEIKPVEEGLLMFMSGIWGLGNSNSVKEFKATVPKIDELIEKLKDKEPKNRKKAVEALGDFDDEIVISTVIDGFEDGDEDVRESAIKAMKKLIHLLPPKNHTQAYHIAKNKYIENHDDFDPVNTFPFLYIFDEALVFDYDLAILEPRLRMGLDLDGACEVDIDVNHLTKSWGHQAKINGVDFGDTDKDGLHDSSYYGESILTFPEAEFNVRDIWILSSNNPKAGDLVTGIEKILIDGNEVESCKAKDSPKIIGRLIAASQRGAAANFLLLFNYVMMYDKVHAGTFDGTHLTAEGLKIVNSYKELSKRFYLKENGEYNIKEIESKMSLDAGTSVRHTDENKFVRFAGFEVEDQIEFAVLMVMRHFLGNQKILGELYGVLYKAAIRNGKINSSEEGILNMISQNWI